MELPFKRGRSVGSSASGGLKNALREVNAFVLGVPFVPFTVILGTAVGASAAEGGLCVEILDGVDDCAAMELLKTDDEKVPEGVLIEGIDAP